MFDKLKDQALGLLEDLGLVFDFDMELDLDFFKTLLNDFDLMSMLPDLADVMDWIVKLVNLALIIGPVILAVMGLWYFLLPSREANRTVGYRFLWGMGSVKSWKFTQRLAGIVWFYIGYRMASEAYDNRFQLQEMETLDLMYTSIEIMIKQVGIVVVSCLAINAVVFLLFNFKGNYRRLWRFLGRKIKELFLFLGGKIKEGVLYLWYKAFPKKENQEIAETIQEDTGEKKERKPGRFSKKKE